MHIVKIDSEDVKSNTVERLFNGAQGILIPGGFGDRGIEGKIRAVQYAREKNVPFFGICLGMQVACIESARNVCGLKEANSTEFDKNTAHPVISLLQEQRSVRNLGASMRLGSYPRKIFKDSKSFHAYKKKISRSATGTGMNSTTRIENSSRRTV